MKTTKAVSRNIGNYPRLFSRLCPIAVAVMLVMSSRQALAQQPGERASRDPGPKSVLDSMCACQLSYNLASLDAAIVDKAGGRKAASNYLAMVDRPESGEAKAAERKGVDVMPGHGRKGLSLDDLAEIAVASHPSVAAKQAERSGADADVQSARWQYFPAPIFSTRRDDRQNNSMVMAVQQPLWAGGRIDASYDSAKSRAFSAELAILEARHNLAMSVSSAYQAWLQSTGRVEAYSRSLRFHEDQMRSISRRVEGGISTDADRELVVSRLSQTSSDLAAAQASVKTSLTRLGQYVGRSVASSEIAKPAAEAALAGGLPKSLDALMDLASIRYPTLRRLDADIEAAQQDVRVKRAAFMPTLNLRAEREIGDAVEATLGTRTDNRVMVTLDFTPGAGFSSVSAVDSAQARALGLRSSRDSAYRDMVDRVSAEYEDFQSAKKRRNDLVRTRKAAVDVLASYSRQFEAGKRGWLDVMNAARELTQVDVSLADVDALLAASAFRLRVYAGEPGWYGDISLAK